MNYWNKFKDLTTRYKVLSVFFILIAFLLISAVILTAVFVFLGSPRSATVASPMSSGPSLSLNPSTSGARDADVSESAEFFPPEDGGGEDIEVKQASMTIDSEDAEAEEVQVRNLSESYDGYIERSRKSETNTLLSLTMTVRVPQDSFEQFIEQLQAEFEVESHAISNFRVPIQRELDELDVLRRSLEDYESIRGDVLAMPTGEEKIELLMDITDKELDLKQREKRFERGLEGKQRQGDMATVNITLEQKLRADLMPEDVGNRLRDGFRRALDSVAGSFIAILANSIAVFFATVKWIVYALIVIVPVVIVSRAGVKLYRRAYLKPKDKNKES